MTAKLTLSIDEEKIKKIKHYSKLNGISVSKFFEKKIDAIEQPSNKKLSIDKLKGIFESLPQNFDLKQEKTARLIKKYVK